MVHYSTLINLLQERSQKQPKDQLYTFLSDGETEGFHLTYKELELRVQAVAAHLQTTASPPARALLLYPPGIEYITAFLGCVFAGITAVPLYPPRFNRPLHRFQAIVKDSQATIALTDSQTLANIQDKIADIPQLNSLHWIASDNIPAQEAEIWRPPSITADSLAFLQYTSGSTSLPKGVALTHANLLNNLEHIWHSFGHTPESKGVIWLPPYHDMGLIGGILQPLYGGFPVVLMPPVAFLQRPLRWLEAISRYQATTSGGPNFAYDLCVEKTTPEQRATLDLSRWQVAFNGAEPIRLETMERFAQAFAPCGFRRNAFYPCYGLAEATLLVTGGKLLSPVETHIVDKTALMQHQVTPPTAPTDGQIMVSSGGTMPNQQVLIVHPETCVVCPPNQIGEIWVKGASIATGGYWQNPDATHAVFQAYVRDTGDGPFLRTGDLGYLHEGQLYVTGRLKDLIIIRGHNYYPQDIENTVIQSHPAFLSTGCAAFSIAVDGVERLVVAQEIKPHEIKNFQVEETAQVVRTAVSQEYQLETYAVLFLRPGKLPKTSSGKLQRYACRQGYLDGTLEVMDKSIPVETSATPPAEPSFIAKTLAVVTDANSRRALLTLYLQEQAARILRQPQTFSPEQSLSSLGIDSLTAVELKNEIETSLRVEIPLTALLEGITLAELVTAVLESFTDQPSASTPSQPPTQLTNPASYGQRALWFLHQLAPESAAYNIASAIRLHIQIDETILRQVLLTLLERHPALRTGFQVENGQPIQTVHPQMALDFVSIQAANWSAETMDDHLRQEAHRPFNLENDVLWRVRLYQQADGTAVLLVVIHHIIADFWSLAVLIHELGTVYTALQSHQPFNLPTLPQTYTAYIQQQKVMLEGAKGQQLAAYWHKQLSSPLPVLDLPIDYPRPPVQTYNGRSLSIQLGQKLTTQLHQFSQTHNVTLYTTLLAAFQVLLHRYSGQADILVGSPAAGRPHADLANIVGYFINPVVLRAHFGQNPTFASFLQQVRQTTLDALKHQEYPFALLVEQLHPQWDPSRTPIFQVMFMFQQAPRLGNYNLTPFALGESGTSITIGNLSLEPVPLAQQTAQFDLTLLMAETPKGLRATFQYNSDLFQADTIQRMLGHFQVLLAGATADPNRLVSQLPLLTEAESKQLLHTWNDTYFPVPSAACIHHLFAAQAAKTPQATAVIFENYSLSYAQLDQRANQLAHHLQTLGIGPDVLVAVCLPRSINMMVALLAVLKAGGAYVPLDPAYPTDRLAFILQDTQAPVLLTTHAQNGRFPLYQGHALCLDTNQHEFATQPTETPPAHTTPNNLAYVIYTSGSTGKPKGVMVRHSNVVNFFAGMDQRIGCGETDTLLAVTSISFDISVLELFWTLTRGAKVVLLSEQAASGVTTKPAVAHKPIEFSLFYFAADEAETAVNKYHLLLEGAKFADQHGFSAVWTPERHFHAFGGLYPNPAVTGAAIAAITQNVQIRAGSVVLPLHHPVRIAEEWSVVDNLSNGRVSLAFASGWHANDFIFYPQNYHNRHQITLEGIETVRRLWRGEKMQVTDGAGSQIEVKVLPRPIQPELPVWVTAAGNPQTFIDAGKIGANILTHLLGQSLADVAEKVTLYRQSLAEHGYDPKNGRVSLMLHTFIGDDLSTIKEKVRQPFMNYLRTSVGLMANLIRSLNLPLDIDQMSQADMQSLLQFAFDRYYETSALFGTPESAMSMVEKVKESGVDDIACLVDFGVPAAEVLSHLHHLQLLQELANSPTADYGLAAQARRYRPTLMQATPSLMRLLLLNPETTESLQTVHTLMVGGEALPPALANQIKTTLPARLVNMYGPTETTIWSTTHTVEAIDAILPIGRPIANTQIYILDQHLQPVPVGITGELYIGGNGVAQGYLNRPALTAERFIEDPFFEPLSAINHQPPSLLSHCLYRTGDLARYQPDGNIEFLGRADHQIKLRGFRIELGEIEALLTTHPSVNSAVVTAHEESPGDKRLIAYVVLHQNYAEVSTRELRDYLKTQLPEYMVPGLFITLRTLPLTANGKVNRLALPKPEQQRPSAGYVAPRSQVEQKVAEIWQQALKIDKVGMDDNFFDIGGHSLLIAQIHSQIRSVFHKEIPLIKILEYPTISAIARFLVEESAEQSQTIITQSLDRAQKQRAAHHRHARVRS